jgi:tetratricopeptide (TPR) repeat protein
MQVLDDWPDQVSSSPVLHAMRARALAGRDQSDAARRWFERALDMAGGTPGEVVSVIQQMRQALGSDEVIGMLQSRARHDTSGVVGLFLARERMMAGQLEQAMQALRDLDGRFSADADREADRQRLLARGHYQSEQYDKARAAYERVLEHAPGDLMALNNLAYLLAEDLDKPEAAMALAERALQLVGENPAQRANVLDTVGWVHFCNGRMRDAEQTLERSVRLKPMAVNHLHLAKVYLAQDRSIPAREQLIAGSELVEEAEDRSVRDEIERLLKSVDSTAANLER